MNKEEKIVEMYSKIELLKPDLEFQIKYTAMKAGEHSTAKTQLEYLKNCIKEYRDRIKELEDQNVLPSS